MRAPTAVSVLTGPYRRAAPPQIQLDPVRQVVQPGDNVLIYCTATGDQPITLRWNKQDGPLPRSVAVRDGELNVSGPV